jgi:hypothetical protein
MFNKYGEEEEDKIDSRQQASCSTADVVILNYGEKSVEIINELDLM